MNRFAFLVNITAVLGISFSERSLEEMMELLRVWEEGFWSFKINLPFTKFGKAMRARTAILEIISEAANLARSTPDISGQASKVLKKVVDAQDENGNGLTQDEIGDLMLGLLFGGMI